MSQNARFSSILKSSDLRHLCPMHGSPKHFNNVPKMLNIFPSMHTNSPAFRMHCQINNELCRTMFSISKLYLDHLMKIWIHGTFIYYLEPLLKLLKLDGIKWHLDMTYGTFPWPIFDVKWGYEVRISIYDLCHMLYFDFCEIMVLLDCRKCWVG